jgi:hypothetical protein
LIGAVLAVTVPELRAAWLRSATKPMLFKVAGVAVVCWVILTAMRSAVISLTRAGCGSNAVDEHGVGALDLLGALALL